MPDYLVAVSSAAPALAMVAALLLAGFGIRLSLRRVTRMKGVLMLVMAGVLVANVAIWTA